MFVVVAYDIEDDRKRVQLHKTLKNFGTPVQYSIFECVLEEVELKRMKEAIRKIVQGDRDRVCYYFLCEGCRRKIEGGPKAPVALDPQVVVL